MILAKMGYHVTLLALHKPWRCSGLWYSLNSDFPKQFVEYEVNEIKIGVQVITDYVVELQQCRRLKKGSLMQ